MWDLYMECIKSDRTRNPKFMIRMPEVCFWRWVHWCDGDVWLKLVVKFVTTEEVAMQDGGVSVNHGDGAPLQQGMVLAPGQSLNVSDLPSGPAQSNDPIAQQSAASMELVSNAPAERPRNRVFKQVYQVHWSDIASAKKLMSGHNPHHTTAVKPANSSLSWKWYRVTIGDIKAEFDGCALSFTSFPIEAYQSKTIGDKQYPDKQHPLETRTFRQIDPSSNN
jgi:hypothetical protein